MHQLGVGLLWVVAAIPILRLALATRRGFDFTDEGFYLLSMQHPRDYLRSSSQFQIPLSLIWSAVPNLPTLRLVRLLALLASANMLGRSVGAVIRRDLQGTEHRWPPNAAVTGITLLGLAGYLWLPQTPGYNDVTQVCGVVAVACLIRFALDRSLTDWNRARLVSIGVATSMLLLAKWPAGVLISFVCLAFLWSLGTDGRRHRFAFVAGGVGLVVLMTQLVSGSIASVLTGLHQGSRDLPSDYATSQLLRDYWEQVRTIPKFAVTDLWLVTTVMLVSALALRIFGPRRGTQTAASVAAAGAMLWSWVHGDLVDSIHLHGRTVSVFVALAALLIIAVAAQSTSEQDGATGPAPVQHLVLVAVLFGAPFALAAGTNNPLLTLAASSGAPLWGAGLVMLCLTNRPSTGALPVITSLVVALGLVTALGGAQRTTSAPYRQPPLSEATFEIADGPLAGLRVDAASAALIESATELTDELRDPFVIGVFKLPGVTAATGATQPIYGWIGDDADERATDALTAACLESERGILLLLTDDLAIPSDIASDCGDRLWVPRGEAETGAGTAMTFWTAAHLTG